MRRTMSTTLALLGLTTALGCSQGTPGSANLALVPATATASAVKAPAQSVATTTATVLANSPATSATVPTDDTTPRVLVRSQESIPGLTTPIAPSQIPADAETSSATAPQFTLEKPRLSVGTTGDVQAAGTNDYLPYNISIYRKTAKSVTLTWQTWANARSVVYLGRTSSLTYHGYTESYYDNTSSRNHWVLIPDLSRFTRYTVAIAGVGPWGGQTTAYPFSFRTNLF